eukprot:Hpha_TRINITY_DN10656_c0_g1::TRINITY_DN10656_c0_g1_i2::g.156821::m.156821
MGEENGAGLVLYVTIHPICSCGHQGSIPLEVRPDATVADVLAQLHKSDALDKDVRSELEYQGRRLSPSELLADTGISNQCQVTIVPPLVVWKANCPSTDGMFVAGELADAHKTPIYVGRTTHGEQLLTGSVYRGVFHYSYGWEEHIVKDPGQYEVLFIADSSRVRWEHVSRAYPRGG